MGYRRLETQLLLGSRSGVVDSLVGLSLTSFNSLGSSLLDLSLASLNGSVSSSLGVSLNGLYTSLSSSFGSSGQTSNGAYDVVNAYLCLSELLLVRVDELLDSAAQFLSLFGLTFGNQSLNLLLSLSQSGSNALSVASLQSLRQSLYGALTTALSGVLSARVTFTT